MQQKAFTLAEVLITLAIIGVVAAVTMPTLIAKYQEKAWKTSADVFDRKLTEALNLMNTNDELVGYKNTEEFVQAFSKYVKIAKVCNEDNLDSCWIKGESGRTILYLSKNNNRKVDEIKLVRTCTGLGLKEAKDIVDKVYSGIPQTITCNDKAASKRFIEDFKATGIAEQNDDIGELCKNEFCNSGKSSINADDLINKLGGNKIQAIKFIRECTGLGLREAKDLVESGTVYCDDPNKLANLGLEVSNANINSINSTNVIIFADGNQALLQYNANCTKVDLGFNKCVGVVYDTTGNKKPNVIGKDRGVLIK